MERNFELTERDYPTEEDWDKYEHLFRESKEAVLIIRKLRASGNTPLRTGKENPEMTRGRAGGMNNCIKRAGLVHRLRSLHPKYYDYICMKFEVSYENTKRVPV